MSKAPGSDYKSTIGATETNKSVIDVCSCHLSTLPLFLNYLKFLLAILSTSSTAPVTTSVCLNRVGAHFQLSLASYSFIISAPISKWEMPKMPQSTPMDLSMLALAHTHAFTHIQRPCSNPNIMSALPAFFCGPAKTKVLTMEEWGCVFLRFCILSKRAKPICGHAQGLEA